MKHNLFIDRNRFVRRHCFVRQLRFMSRNCHIQCRLQQGSVQIILLITLFSLSLLFTQQRSQQLLIHGRQNQLAQELATARDAAFESLVWGLNQTWSAEHNKRWQCRSSPVSAHPYQVCLGVFGAKVESDALLWVNREHGEVLPSYALWVERLIGADKTRVTLKTLVGGLTDYCPLQSERCP